MENGLEDVEINGRSIPLLTTRNRVRNAAFQGHWQQDQGFFERFFPVNADTLRTSSQVKSKLYEGSDAWPRWKGIPNNPEIVDYRVYNPLSNLLNGILDYFGLLTHRENPRRFVEMHFNQVLSGYDDKSVWPGILLAGAAKSFICWKESRRTADYTSGISPLKVIVEGADVELARDHLARDVQAIFNRQPNRRFAFGLVIGPSTLICYLFDHSGVICSPPLDYHQQTSQFCALIAGIASPEAECIGLDTTMFYDENQIRSILTRVPNEEAGHSTITYKTIAVFFYAPCILGRGTACFLAYRDGHPGANYVIKDSWMEVDSAFAGRESEGSLLLHAQRKGIVRGIAQICHYEEVLLKGPGDRLMVDSIINNRRVTPESFNGCQRVHTRIVMSTYGKALQNFSTRKELLFAYYDALQAHRNLYGIAGILHRDIKPDHILIRNDGVEGDRGILIDLDHAIRTDNTSPYSTRKRVGTYLFMSFNALQGNDPNCYLDDLESFYYVLVYMVTKFSGPGSPRNGNPQVMEGWSGPFAAEIKKGLFTLTRSKVVVEPWFGAPFHNLVTRLHTLFGSRVKAIARADLLRTALPVIDPMQESDKFLSYVRQAIEELEEEEASAGHIIGYHTTVASVCSDDGDSDEDQPPKKRRRQG